MLRPELEFHPEAIAEAAAARLWYAERSTAAADAFMGELDHAVVRISEAPNRWPVYLHGTRRYLMRRFPFLVAYRLKADVLEVVAVAHAGRRPGYWNQR